MTTTTLPSRIPDAIPVDDELPRIVPMSPRLPEAPVDEEGGGINPLRYLRYRWVMILFLGATIGSVLAFAAWSFIPSKYTTTSIIRVSPQDPRIFFNEDPHGKNDFNSYLKTQAGLLRSHFVLNAALRDPDVASLPMLKEQQDPVRFLEEELQVEYSDGSELIKPKLAGDDPRAISMILNAIHDSYFNEIVEAERKRKQKRLKDIEDSVVTMQRDLQKKILPGEKTEEKPAESLPGVGPNLAASQMTRYREKLDVIEVKQKQVEEEKKRLARRMDHPEAEVPPVPSGFVAQLEGDPVIAGINRRLASWQKQLDYLTKLNNDPENPGVKDLKQQIGEAAQDRERVRKERIEEFQKSMVGEIARRMEQDDERLDAEVQSLKIQHEKTAKELKEYEDKLAKILPPSEGGVKDFAKVDTQSRSEIISGLMEKANLLRLELSAPTRVQSFQKAAVPKKREMKKQLLGAAVAGLMGFLLVAAGVVLYESRVRRAMCMEDVRKATLGPMLGAIPQIDPTATEPTPEMALAEEAIEKMRANLQQQFGRAGSRVVCVTSAVAEEGRTFLARELSLSYARAGYRTLLVDFDLRTPSLHEFFETSNDCGATDVLCGSTELDRAIYATQYGIALLPAGTWNDRVRQYLSNDQVAALTGQLREMFDVVVVNTHPILNVAETSFVGRSADAVVLTAEKFETRIPLVGRAQEKIASLAPEAFGVVFIGASTDECLQ
jgi:polysaccharide biosynthesis transport protein